MFRLALIASLMSQSCASWAQETPRVEEVTRHEDGTVTAKVRPAALTAGELDLLLRPYATEKALVRVVGTSLLVRDTPARIKEMEKILAAFDVPAQAVEITFEIAWSRGTPATKGEGKAVPERTRTVTLHAMVDREFRSSGTEEEPYAAEILEHPGGTNVTKRYRPTGVTVSGRLTRRSGDRLDLQIKLDVMDVLPDKKFRGEQFELAVPLENGKQRRVAAVGENPSAAIEVRVTATLK
ncbi:MAG: hypothetical protein HYY17_12860 [Planctomycetes bacterium]|nr:hypothetical protein [Planctomycetota bacterium]